MEDGEGSRGCLRRWRVEVNKLEGEERAKVVVHILFLHANRRVGVGLDYLLPSITIYGRESMYLLYVLLRIWTTARTAGYLACPDANSSPPAQTGSV